MYFYFKNNNRLFINKYDVFSCLIQSKDIHSLYLFVKTDILTKVKFYIAREAWPATGKFMVMSDVS